VAPALPHLAGSRGWDCSQSGVTPGKGELKTPYSSMSVVPEARFSWLDTQQALNNYLLLG